MAHPANELKQLLRLCGVQSGYEDVEKRRCRASTDALLSMLRSLGIDIRSPDSAGPFLREHLEKKLMRGIEPVYVAWNGVVPPLTLTVPSNLRPSKAAYFLKSDSAQIEGNISLGELRAVATPHNDARFVAFELSLPHALEPGYYELQIEAGGKSFRSLIISAPRHAFHHGEPNSPDREWSCFLPLYALRTREDWGVGDFSTLTRLACWAGSCGASEVGTLPILAAFLDEPYSISPYGPASRLFWNEFYLDVASIPELALAKTARELIGSADFQSRIYDQRRAELVDYREIMSLKRSVLEQLSAEFFSKRPTRFGDFQQFLNEQPAVAEYATFRAVGERKKTAWTEWPENMKAGHLTAGDYDQSAKNYHLYVQWLATEQLSRLRRESQAAGCGLYLDLPIGTDPRGYDVWRYQESYITGANAGAPPDVFFKKGQDWGLPPLHPQHIRENGYDLFRQVLATSMKVARRLRIDHIMGLHRVFCIAPGFAAADGTYIHYEADELFAIAAVESHRNQCELVGENLGTVPKEVDRALATHAIAGMWVAPYELEPGRAGLSAPTKAQVAMLNTHDMPPLAGWWNGNDIADRKLLGHIEAGDAAQQEMERKISKRKMRDWLHSQELLPSDEDLDHAPLMPLLKAMSSSAARSVVVNLEDLWLENRPQNVPGTSPAVTPNWQRKARLTFEEFTEAPEVIRAIEAVDRLRRTNSSLERGLL